MVLVGTACSAESTEPKPLPGASAPTVSEVTLGIHGHPEEMAVYTQLVKEFNASHKRVHVKLAEWAPADATQAIRTGQKLPDVFLGDYTDFTTLIADARIQPVSNLLDERGISFGDRYDRHAIEAFSADNLLQCMPYELNPQVLFYNTDLINLEDMTAASLETPSPTKAWTFSEFSSAVSYAAKPKRGISGLAVDPTIAGLGSYLYTAGAELVDNETEPSTLTFGDDSTREALDQVLPVLRDPKIVMGKQRLAKKSAVEWFKQGKVAVISGSRELVPELRKVEGLNWDVARMPKLAENATTASLNGLCISATATDPGAAADVIADLVDDASLTDLAQVGYLMPANVSVGGSDAVTQEGQVPANGAAFLLSQRTMRLPARVPDYQALDAAVRPEIEALLFDGPTIDVALIAEAIDTTSADVIAQQRATLAGETLPPSPSAPSSGATSSETATPAAD